MLTLALAFSLLMVSVSLDPSPFEAAYPHEEARFYGVDDGLPSDNALDIAVRGDGTPIVITDRGIATFRDGGWQVLEADLGFVPMVCAAAPGDGMAMWIAGGDTCACIGATRQEVRLEGDVVNALAPSDSILFAGTNRGIWRVENGIASRIWNAPGPVLSLALHKSDLSVGTADGLMSLKVDGRNATPIYPSDERSSWAPKHVAALAAFENELWFGCMAGAGHRETGAWSLYTGNEGLPYDHFTDAAAAGPGVVWLGTQRGAIRFERGLADSVRVRAVGYEDRPPDVPAAFDDADGCWFYRAGMRWLPDDRVNAVAVGPEGDAWVATPKGVSHIVRRPQTLAEKAAEFERIIDARHRRLGEFVLRCYFEEPGNLDTAYQRATDNDGLYTAMYGAAQCFRYAATHEPRAKENAQRTFRGLKKLVDVTGIPGFPARAIQPIDSGEDPNERFGEAQNLAMQKEDPLWKNIVPRWPVSVDGKYWWKCDTSSDEVAGHYFFYAVYHDLVCETDAERREVADLVHALTTHIVDHNFTLTDHDGKPTRWAQWSPEYVNGIDGWADRGIQSVEILSFLNVGLKLTGDRKFAEAAAYLRNEHDYHINAIRSRSFWPPSTIVPWDNNLAFLSFYGLIKYEDDPALNAMYRLALDNAWSFSARQNDPFFNLTYLSLYPEDEPRTESTPAERSRALAHAVETLARTPRLLIGWRMENSHRRDVYRDPTPRRGKEYGWLLNGNAVPIEERSHIRINSDHFDLDGGGNGDVEYEGTFFLLPYYMGLHYGFIQP